MDVIVTVSAVMNTTNSCKVDILLSLFLCISLFFRCSNSGNTSLLMMLLLSTMLH